MMTCEDMQSHSPEHYCNISPENPWLEDSLFPLGMIPFQLLHVHFSEAGGTCA